MDWHELETCASLSKLEQIIFMFSNKIKARIIMVLQLSNNT